MASDVFVGWLEDRLREHGAGKVVPDLDALGAVWRRAVARQQIADDVRGLGSVFKAGPALPDLRRRTGPARRKSRILGVAAGANGPALLAERQAQKFENGA